MNDPAGWSRQFRFACMVLAVALATAACATQGDRSPGREQPAAVPAQPAVDVANASPSPAPTAAVLVLVDLQLHEAVRTAAANAAPSLQISFDGESAADDADFRLELALHSVVDRSGQERNQEGAMATGLGLFGALMPWVCPTTHTLGGHLSDRNGVELGSYEKQKSEKRVGTMLACWDVDHPKESIVVDLVSDILREIGNAGVLQGQTTEQAPN